MSVPIWVNGELYEPDKAVISVYDHGLMVGDGVFETVKAVNGESFALTRHLERLALSAKRMDLPEPDLAAIADGVGRCLEAAPKWPLARIRITYTSGPGPLGSDRGAAGTNAIVIVGEQAPFPATPTSPSCPGPATSAARWPASRAPPTATTPRPWRTPRSAAAPRRSSRTSPGTCARAPAATSSSSPAGG